jgi:glycosyltransferase involved in cell wall biosynthesis
MAVDGASLAVVIPAFRAAATIGDLLRRIPGYADWIIVVDDASPDDLADRVAEVADPRVILIRHEHNLGVGGATVTGYRRAIELGALCVAKIDADGQMEPRFLDRFVRMALKHGCDYVKGNRFGDLDALRTMPRVRLAGNVLLTFLTKVASGYWNVFDPQNGYVLITRRMLRMLNLDQLDRGYSFENSMLINLNIFRARLGELFLPASYDEHASSMRLWRIVFTFPLHLARGFCRRVYHKYFFRSMSPFLPLVAFGSVASLWGALWGGFVWLRSIRTGVAAATGTVILALLPLLLGWSSLLQALVLDVQDAGPCVLFDVDDESLLTGPEAPGRGPETLRAAP